MSSVPPKVLIVGGGPSGLIFALALLQNGVPVRLIEKSSDPRIGQRGAGIMPRSLELFTTLGLADKVLKLAIPTPPVRMYEMPEGIHPIHEFEMAPRVNPTPPCPFLNIVLLGQDRLEKILHAALAEYGCHVELGTELVTLEQHKYGVDVKLLKRGMDMSSPGVPESASYEYLIGADGGRGVVRKLSGFTFLGETKNIKNLVVGDIHVEGLSRDYWHMWGDANSILISLRPTEVPTLFNFIIAGRDVNHSKLSTDKEAVRQLFMKNTGTKTNLKFTQVAWLSYYTPNIRMVDKFDNGRVFLAGDSAHVHSPTGGQGMNTGIQDSFNLAWKLALVVRGLAPYSLLKSYTEERLPVIKEMLDRTTKILNRTFKENHHSEGWESSGELLQLGVNCRWSSIVIDERKQAELAEDADFADFDFGDESDEEKPDEEKIDSYGMRAGSVLRAGDRAPDAPGLIPRMTGSKPSITTRHLFQLFGSSYHTVLIFTPALAQCLPILKALAIYPQGTIRSAVIVPPGRPVPPQSAGADFVLEDRDGHAHEGYGINEKWGVVIVRPDGVVGAIVGGASGVREYFTRIFGRKTTL
ncbi:Pentachlorophenol 4-monooxygenase [Hypsizygus marmoreus]|uniref:Pentachlorophenol 4-monooxygenase n=1 Tax=Hypsizygus marmoreus TaxID=39966 RepID=A0A369JVR5_HYPMA|nr:Pentachlorophenol 4-monooxygenase [Hypsizygus marmoreus]